MRFTRHSSRFLTLSHLKNSRPAAKIADIAMELPDECFNELDLTHYGYSLQSLMDGYKLSNYHEFHYITNLKSGKTLVAKVTGTYGVPKMVINTLYNESNILNYLYDCWNSQQGHINDIVYNIKLGRDLTQSFDSGLSDTSTCVTPSSSQECLDLDQSPSNVPRYYDKEFVPFIVLESTIMANTHLVMVMEHCLGGSLYSFIDEHASQQLGIEPEPINSFISQILFALEFIHSRGVFHGDINPTNILFADKERTMLKIADFEAARRFDTEEHQPCSLLVSNSPNRYSSPQQLMGHDTISPSNDLWSTGCILYELITLQHFDVANIFTENGANDATAREKYYEHKLQLFTRLPSKYSRFVPLLDRLLDLNPNRRLEAYRLTLPIVIN